MPPDHNPPPPAPPPAQPQTLPYSHQRRRTPLGEILFLVFIWMPAVVVTIALVIWALQVNDDEQRFLEVLAYMTGPLMFVIAGTLVLLTISAIFRGITSSRKERARAILGYLENAIRLNFPLDRFLQAAEESEGLGRRLRLMMLRSALQQGMPVGTALRVAVPDVPLRISASLAAAENIGQLQPALTRLIERDTRDANSEPQTTPFYRFYFPLMLVAVFGLTSFILIFVAPKFREIFKDFHTTLPPLTDFLFTLGNALFDDDIVLAVLLGALALTALVIIARALQQFVRLVRGVPRTPFFFGFTLRWMAWYVPLWRQVIRDRTLSEVMEFLADALRAGLPLPQALDAALALSVPPGMRQQFERWLDGLLGGDLPAIAAQRAGLPRLIVGFLQTGSRAGAHPWAGADVFDFLARYYRERFSRLRIFLRAAAEPLAALFLGLLVGTVVLGIFLPLVKLLNSVMGGAERGFL